MSYNFLNFDGRLTPNTSCENDSNVGYEADFSNDGDVNGWEYYDGIHTYGCWNNFLFGTLYDEYAVVGRYTTFIPLAAEDFYTVKIVMKLNLKERVGSQIYPPYGRIMWRTLSDPSWSDSKQHDFELYSDTEWHTYIINMGEIQWWQGDINDLRIYPILSKGRDGDEFFIRSIEISSVNKYKCTNYGCDYYPYYEHNCPGIGERGYCKSKELGLFTQEGTQFAFSGSQNFKIEEGINNVLYVNINEYGYENIVLEPAESISGHQLAAVLAREISKLDVGGYAECDVEYTNRGAFIIYSGVYADDSTVAIGDSQLARDLNFFDSSGKDISTKHVGSNPASGFRPYSSFRIKTHQIYGLLDSNDKSKFFFNPFIYSLEGGRRDWLYAGLGLPDKDVRGTGDDSSNVMNRSYKAINNAGKTIIDFSHPFNASGRVTKIFAGITLDNFERQWQFARGTHDADRIDSQLTGAKIMFFRPLKNGDLRVLPLELDIENRKHDEGKLYSAVQEYTEIDCDVFVNKGDLIGVYNANVYKSRSVSGEEVDALYYQVDGKASGTLYFRQPSGQGNSGLLLYARGDQQQNRLVLDLDLGKRVNVEDIKVKGESIDERLEYNIARCLDVDWEVDLFGEDHTTGYIYRYRPLTKHYYNHPNLYYGKECLNDGIKTAPEGLAADGFSLEYGNYYYSHPAAIHQKDGGRGVILSGPKYFSVNGDCEWLKVYYHANRQEPFVTDDFSSDPIAFTLRFPFNKEKLMHKSRIYFKEQYNMRSFAISKYEGPYYTEGNADDVRFNLIPNRTDITVSGIAPTPWTKLVLDGIEYTPDDALTWNTLNLYLARNPTIGHQITQDTGIQEIGFDEDLAYFDELGGLYIYATGVVLNHNQYMQSLFFDWTTLEHEWPPIYGRGYRFYCDFHESTKICEFEVYCVVENVRSSMGGSVSIDYSPYGEDWWPAQNFVEDYGVRSFIGDTPRYARLIIKPITEVYLSDLDIDVSYEDVFMGQKGCQHTFLPAEAKRGSVGQAQRIDFKNVYGRSYDLYVNIAGEELLDPGVVFYSTLIDRDSIENPVIGPDAYYKKHADYRLANYNRNVAINCPVYRLKNLLDGADAWYSHDRERTWRYWGKISEGNNLNFSNLPESAITTVNLPVLNRSKWWKIGFYDPRIVMSVREIRVYYQNVEIEGAKFYHHKNQDAIAGGNTDTAPHLSNGIIDGSYYVLKGDHYIGIELPDVQEMDRLVIYHDYLLEYENSPDKAGIDIATALCIHGDGDLYQTSSIVDVSYYEHAVQVVGSGIYCDPLSTTYDFGFTEDFSDCNSLIETFDGPGIDTSFWVNPINAHVESGELYITNSGIITGELTTVDYFYNDFEVTVDLSIDDPETNAGWGGFLVAEAAGTESVSVGRDYSVFYGDGFVGKYKDFGGQGDLNRYVTTETQDLRLRLKRDGSTTYVYAATSTGDWQSLGSTQAIETYPVKMKLISYYSPVASGITTARFDDFTVDKSDADWAVNTDYSSTFTCTSGINPTVSGGWGYYYDIGTVNHSNAAGYKRPRINAFYNDPLDNTYSFTFKFTFQGDIFLDGYSDPANNVGVSVGMLGYHVQERTGYYRWQPFFTGAQVVIRRDNIGIGVRTFYAAGASNYASLDTTAQPYYCKFTGDGDGNYNVTVWTDDWDGAVEVASVSLSTSLEWVADKVGVGSGYSSNGSRVGRCTGWVSNFDFECEKTVKHGVLDTAIRFSGYPNEYILVDYDSNPNCNISRETFDLDTKNFTIDFHIMFSSLPANDGDKAWIIGSWHPDQSLSHGASIGSSTASSWLLYIERVSGGYRWRFAANINSVVNRIMDWSFYPDLFRWYHFMFCRGPEEHHDSWVLIRDGRTVTNEWQSSFDDIKWSRADVIIGKDLEGWIDEIRVSSDYTQGGGRANSRYTTYYFINTAVPTKQYERYYTMSIYNSNDNIYYGKNMDVDVLFDNSYSYHEPFSKWSEKYYTYFAIDFGQRHAIDIVRSFPIDTSFQFTRTENILYSNKDTTDPVEAFSLTEEELELSTDFEGQNYDYPHNFIKQDSTRTASYIIDDTFYQMANGVAGTESSTAKFKPYFRDDFDLQIDFDLGDNPPNVESWSILLEVVDISNSNNKIRFERHFKDGSHKYALYVRDNSSSWSLISVNYRNDKRGTMRLTRNDKTFEAYFKPAGGSYETMMGFYQAKNTFDIELEFYLQTYSAGSSYPKIEVWWDNFIINTAEPIYSSSADTRWMRVKMLNGDGTTRTIKKAGVYPDISVQANAVAQYNCIWEPLGAAITSYTTAENIALGATVSGSSYVGTMEPFNAVNGEKGTRDLNYCWGSEEANIDPEPYLIIKLPYTAQIFRFVLYHGYDEADTFNIITDYKIQVSTDGVSYTTVFNITNNSLFERTHDLVSPVLAKYVRFYVEGYKATEKFVWKNEFEGFQFWKGAVLREIEIYEYYGFEVINSEDSPVIAIDLKQGYFIDGHSLTGIYTEEPEYDWDNDESNFAYSNSNLSDPKKIGFRDWGSGPAFDRWVAIKRNTATHYPTVPTLQQPQTDMPDYLKHAIINANANDMGLTPNPVEYPWMWRSNLSDLSYDYDNIYGGHMVNRSLKIEYPASSESENVRFIEGDTFGVDSIASWRDGLGFYFYIDDLDNLDLDYGYFYFGGFDKTPDRNPVVHKWNWTTFSGALQSGWNSLCLTFLYADEVEYTPLLDNRLNDPRILSDIEWGRLGLVFRGKGNPITMNLDGFYIERNHFEHYCFQGPGLYLHGNDVLKVQPGQLDLHSGTIEFFIRPDWEWFGKDRYSEYKHRALFHFGNVNNDVFGASMSTNGMEIYYGNSAKTLQILAVPTEPFSMMETVTHFAFVFSNDGKGIGPDGSTVRFYINNNLYAKTNSTWEVGDDKHFNFTFGGQSVLSQKVTGVSKLASSVDGVVSRLRIYNYCKLDFSDSMTNNEEALNKRILDKPSEFIEISDDNVTFHRVGSDQLPFFFEDVPAGESVPVWVRVALPRKLYGEEKRTARILGSWDIGV